MARLTILGSAAAVSDATHDNTHFILQGDHSTVLVDCGSNAAVKLRRCGIHFNMLTDVILTHFHPDHVYGVPMLLNHMSLLGRRLPLRIFGLNHCLLRTEELIEAFSWYDWPQMFPLEFHHLPSRKNELVLDNADFKITAWPVRHYTMPTIGLRIISKATGKIIGYSCDTSPTPNVVEIGRDADIFFHEAAGNDPFGHSSAAQAGEMASEAGAKRLALIHYEVWEKDPLPLIAEARTTFSGPVEITNDYTVYDI